MPITRDEVAHLARLSRIALSDAELDHLAPQLDQIITAVAQVQEVTAEGIPPTSHATGLTNVFRDDELTPCLTPEEALSQAPATEPGREREAAYAVAAGSRKKIRELSARLVSGARRSEYRSCPARPA